MASYRLLWLEKLNRNNKAKKAITINFDKRRHWTECMDYCLTLCWSSTQDPGPSSWRDAVSKTRKSFEREKSFARSNDAKTCANSPWTLAWSCLGRQPQSFNFAAIVIRLCHASRGKNWTDCNKIKQDVRYGQQNFLKVLSSCQWC